MSRYDRKSGIVLLIISALLCYGAVRLGIGALRNPGAGLLPLITGLIIGVLSIPLVFGRSVPSTSPSPPAEPFFTSRAGLFLGVLVLFGVFVERAGFLICTFFGVIIMLRANGMRRYSYVFLASTLICISIFLLFDKILGVRLPWGILGFLGG